MIYNPLNAWESSAKCRRRPGSRSASGIWRTGERARRHPGARAPQPAAGGGLPEVPLFDALVHDFKTNLERMGGVFVSSLDIRKTFPDAKVIVSTVPEVKAIVPCRATQRSSKTSTSP